MSESDSSVDVVRMNIRRVLATWTPVMMAATVGLGVPVSAPATAATGSFPEEGAYATQGDSTIISDDGELQVSWIASQVFPWEGGIPTRWQVDVIYANTSDNVLYLTCEGWDTSNVRETIFRDGKNIGHVEAEHDLCSDHPDWNANLSPQHRLLLSWAVFHNVPWKGDEVSLQWGDYGTSKPLDPFGH
ncbi:hypothetical protein ABZ464_01700 [Streptomyces sp. NPDC005820]|uniref:hypothetical protein n=1 Tax=Streptomyces sp. NPDC005820 TaxID=3157069 RepID=UPI0033CCB41E